MDQETANSVARGAQSIIMRSVDSLVASTRNPRTHSESQITAIAKSIERFGFTNPILLNGACNIIAGHGRLAASKLLGMTEVPCIDLNGLTEVEQRAYLIADNQLAVAAGWDLRMLADELQELTQEGIDAALLGFSEAELATLEAVGSAEGLDHWSGMPEFDQPDVSGFRHILVHFHDQAGVDAFAVLTGQNISDKTKFIWFPNEERFAASEYRYESDAKPEAGE